MPYIGLDDIDISSIREADAIRKIRDYACTLKSRKSGYQSKIVLGLEERRPKLSFLPKIRSLNKITLKG